MEDLVIIRNTSSTMEMSIRTQKILQPNMVDKNISLWYSLCSNPGIASILISASPSITNVNDKPVMIL